MGRIITVSVVLIVGIFGSVVGLIPEWVGISMGLFWSMGAIVFGIQYGLMAERHLDEFHGIIKFLLAGGIVSAFFWPITAPFIFHAHAKINCKNLSNGKDSAVLMTSLF